MDLHLLQLKERKRQQKKQQAQLQQKQREGEDPKGSSLNAGRNEQGQLVDLLATRHLTGGSRHVEDYTEDAVCSVCGEPHSEVGRGSC